MLAILLKLEQRHADGRHFLASRQSVKRERNPFDANPEVLCGEDRQPANVGIALRDRPRVCVRRTRGRLLLVRTCTRCAEDHHSRQRPPPDRQQLVNTRRNEFSTLD